MHNWTAHCIHHEKGFLHFFAGFHWGKWGKPLEVRSLPPRLNDPSYLNVINGSFSYLSSLTWGGEWTQVSLRGKPTNSEGTLTVHHCQHGMSYKTQTDNVQSFARQKWEHLKTTLYCKIHNLLINGLGLLLVVRWTFPAFFKNIFLKSEVNRAIIYSVYKKLGVIVSKLEDILTSLTSSRMWVCKIIQPTSVSALFWRDNQIYQLQADVANWLQQVQSKL